MEDKGSKVLTYASRLKAIWDDVAASRAKFERTPDKGLLGKTVSRFFNRVWNYLIKGAFGTLALSVVFPPLCLGVSTLSLVLGLSAPLWYPLLNLALHLLFVLVFDFDYFGKNFHEREVTSTRGL